MKSLTKAQVYDKCVIYSCTFVPNCNLNLSDSPVNIWLLFYLFKGQLGFFCYHFKCQVSVIGWPFKRQLWKTKKNKQASKKTFNDELSCKRDSSNNFSSTFVRETTKPECIVLIWYSHQWSGRKQSKIDDI